MWLNMVLGSGGITTDFFLRGRYTEATSQGGAAVQKYTVIVALLGFFVDFFLILGTNRIVLHSLEWKRAAAAALIAGIHAGMCFVPGFSFLRGNLWRCVFLGLISAAAFGFGGNGLRRITVYFLLRFALSGAALAAGSRGIGSVLLAIVIVALLCVVGLAGKRIGRDYVPVEVCYADKKWDLVALRDSGNLLRDPLTGEQVLVADADVGERLLGLSAHQLAKPAETLLAGLAPGMRLIPYQTIGQSGAMLLAVRLQDVRIGSKRGSAMVAFAPERFDDRGGYQMLIGGML